MRVSQDQECCRVCGWCCSWLAWAELRAGVRLMLVAEDWNPTMHISVVTHTPTTPHSLLTTLTWASVAKTIQIWILMIVVWCDCEVVKSIWKKMIEVNMKGGDGDERLSIWCFLFCFLPRPYFLSEDYIYRSNTHSASQESFTFSLWLLSLVRFHGFTILNIKYILVKIQNKMFLFSILTTKL